MPEQQLPVNVYSSGILTASNSYMTWTTLSSGGNDLMTVADGGVVTLAVVSGGARIEGTSGARFSGGMRTSGNGGGILITSGGSVNLVNPEFLSNSATERGGAICNSNGSVVISGLEYPKNVGNSAKWGGFLEQRSTDSNAIIASTLIYDCNLSLNSAGERGGVFSNQDAKLTVIGGNI